MSNLLSRAGGAAPVAPGSGLSRGMVRLFAIAAGIAVANIYYAQPLLTAIARTFHVGSGSASLIVVLGQVGYTAGLALLVPLGDLTNRRRLIVTLMLVTAVAQAASAVAPALWVLDLGAAVLSMTAVAGPILVPFAATLAAPDRRGQVTGTVMSGVLLGVLLSRTVGGLIAQAGGWRSVYAVAAVLSVALAVVLACALPTIPLGERLSYPALLGSVFTLLRQEPTLRLRCSFGFLGFGTFSILWTSLAFLLGGAPYHFDEAVIGLFGLAGAAGALAARVAGRWTDRGQDRGATGAMFATILLGWVLLGLAGGSWLVTVLLGVIVLDLGVQGAHVTNFGVIYRIRPEVRSRVTTAYMTSVFLGGVAGASASAAAYAAWGWIGVCVAGGVFTLAALAIWALSGTRTATEVAG